MRAKEIKRQLRRALRYPRLWVESGLLDGELLEIQLRELQKIIGYRSRSLRSTEHWRYGAFVWWLRRVQNTEQLMARLRVAAIDPDEPMGQSVIKEISLHPMANDDVKRFALTLRS